MSDMHQAKLIWPHTEAETVLVGGDYDDWSSSTPLTKVEGGFEGLVEVPWNSKIEYKFLVDGEWRTSDALETESDPSGRYVNNVYHSPPRPAGAASGLGVSGALGYVGSLIWGSGDSTKAADASSAKSVHEDGISVATKTESNQDAIPATVTETVGSEIIEEEVPIAPVAPAPVDPLVTPILDASSKPTNAQNSANGIAPIATSTTNIAGEPEASTHSPVVITANGNGNGAAGAHSTAKETTATNGTILKAATEETDAPKPEMEKLNNLAAVTAASAAGFIGMGTLSGKQVPAAVAEQPIEHSTPQITVISATPTEKEEFLDAKTGPIENSKATNGSVYNSTAAPYATTDTGVTQPVEVVEATPPVNGNAERKVISEEKSVDGAPHITTAAEASEPVHGTEKKETDTELLAPATPRKARPSADSSPSSSRFSTIGLSKRNSFFRRNDSDAASINSNGSDPSPRKRKTSFIAKVKHALHIDGKPHHSGHTSRSASISTPLAESTSES